MSQLNKLPQDFVKTFIRHTKMIHFVGLDVLDDSIAFKTKKFIKFFIYITLLCLMFIGQSLYVLKRNDVNANFSQIICAIPSILISIQGKLCKSLFFLLFSYKSCLSYIYKV